MRDTMEQPSNADRFIIAFAKIERSLNEITRRPKYVPFKTNARVAARYNAVVSNHLDELNTFAELRNPMVHQRDNKDEILAQPTDAVTESVERIAELLQKDQSVITYATSPWRIWLMEANIGMGVVILALFAAAFFGRKKQKNIEVVNP